MENILLAVINILITILFGILYLLMSVLFLALSGVDVPRMTFSTKKDVILNALKVLFGLLYAVYTLLGFLLCRGPKMFFIWWKNLPDEKVKQ